MNRTPTFSAVSFGEALEALETLRRAIEIHKFAQEHLTRRQCDLADGLRLEADAKVFRIIEDLSWGSK